MKRTTLLLPFLLLAAACSGIKVRENALMFTMLKAWSKVAQHAEAGIAAGEAAATVTPAHAAELRDQVGEMETALGSGDRFQVAAVNWPLLRQVALVGINARTAAGEIGPTVAMSHVETVNLFDQQHTRLLLR